MHLKMGIRNRNSLSKLYNLRIFHSISGQAVLIFSIALLIRIAVAVLQHAWLHNLRAEMEREAISMASTGVLGNAFSLPTGPSATVPPLYPLIMSVIFRLFGTGVAGESVKVLLTCIVSSLQYALIPWIAKRLGFTGIVGFMAGMLGALTPLNPYIEVQGDFENHLSGLLLLILLGCTEIAGRVAWSTGKAFALGVFYGICTLTSPSLAPLCFISFLYVLFRQRKATSGMLPLVAVSVLASLTVVAPWGIRNYIQLGSPILTRSNFGLEFSLANNDLASPLMMENQRLFGCCHPLFSEDEARKVQAIGEVEYNARLKRKTLEWIDEHRAQFARLTALRVWYLWFPKAPEALRTLTFRLLSLLSVVGIVAVWRTNRKSALFLLVPLIVYPLPYYLVQIHFRYRYPFHFIMLLLSCAAMYGLWKRSTASRQHSDLTTMQPA